jgi:hypothetical protein
MKRGTVNGQPVALDVDEGEIFFSRDAYLAEPMNDGWQP